MREKFYKIIFADGGCVINIVTPSDMDSNTSGSCLCKEAISQSDITPHLLHMLAESYYAGYQEARVDAIAAIKGLIKDSKQYRKPVAKISMVTDYSKI